MVYQGLHAIILLASNLISPIILIIGEDVFRKGDTKLLLESLIVINKFGFLFCFNTFWIAWVEYLGCAQWT